jgi:hypothetical protein
VPVDLNFRRIVFIGALALLAVPLVAFGVIGVFSRYAADDYCTAGQLATAGFSGAQLNLYEGWSGRFSATFLITLLEAVGIAAVPALAVAALTIWVVAAAWAIRGFAVAVNRPVDVLSSAVLAVLLVYATLRTTADMPQDLYWQTGLVTYLSPLVLATMYAGWIARFRSIQRRSIRLGVCFVLAFLAGGTSETFAVAQVVGFAFAGVVAWLAEKPPRRLVPMLLTGLAGALLALATLAVAPGNEVRQAGASRTPLGVALPQAMDFMWGWLRLTFARPNAITLALLVLLPAAILAVSPSPSVVKAKQLITGFVVAIVGILLVILACMLPAFYALGTNPPGRAQILPEYLALLGVGLAGAVLGILAKAYVVPTLDRPAGRAVAVLALLALLVAGPLATARETLTQISDASTYAARWDDIDRQIRMDRQQGLTSIVVPPLAATGSVRNLDFVGADPGDWFNQCVARYYSVPSIAAAAHGRPFGNRSAMYAVTL